MSDRCYMSMVIGGHIETFHQLSGLAQAILLELGQDIEDPVLFNKMQTEIIEHIDRGSICFDFAEIDCAILECAKAIHAFGFDVCATNERGMNYGPGTQSWNGLTGEIFGWALSDDGIFLPDIESALLLEFPLKAIRALLDEQTRQQWTDIRPLTISDDVRKQVTKLPACANNFNHSHHPKNHHIAVTG